MSFMLPETINKGLSFRVIQWYSLTRLFLALEQQSDRPKTNPQVLMTLGGLGYKSLTMSYFHKCTSTIIGAKVFHGPVRDGKGWDHLAMVVKRSLLNG